MTGPSKRWLPGAVAVLAIAAMAVAARRDGPLDGGVGTGLWGGARPVAALAAVVLLVAVATNFAKHRDDGYGVLHRAGTATAVLLTAAAILTPFGLLFFGRKPEKPGQQPETSNGPGSPRSRGSGPDLKAGSGHGSSKSYDWLGLTLLYLILAAALGLLVYVLVKLLARHWFRREQIALLAFDPLAPELEQLAEAVAAGAEALEYEGDAREAVIACYSAMELAVSAGGGTRRATDTPEEFLRRVTAANLIPEEPARKLTDLFREARFSRHRIAEEKRDAARAALRAISEHLRVRAEEAAAAAARAQAAASAASAGSSASGSSGSSGSSGEGRR